MPSRLRLPSQARRTFSGELSTPLTPLGLNRNPNFVAITTLSRGTSRKNRPAALHWCRARRSRRCQENCRRVANNGEEHGAIPLHQRVRKQRTCPCTQVLGRKPTDHFSKTALFHDCSLRVFDRASRCWMKSSRFPLPG